MATSLAEVRRFTRDRRDAQIRNIGHAITSRMHPRQGYAWLSERLLFRDICHCSWGEGIELVQELIAAGEFYRVTARGPGRGRGRTLYFRGWANANVIRHELEENAMPLAAFHHVERCLAEYKARVTARISFFDRLNDAAEHRHRLPQRGVTKEKDGRKAPDHPSRAAPGSPRAGQIRPSGLETPRRVTALSRHGAEMRRLQAERDRFRRGD